MRTDPLSPFSAKPIDHEATGYDRVTNNLPSGAGFPVQKNVEDAFLRKSSPLFSFQALPSYRGNDRGVGRGVYHLLRSIVVRSAQEMTLDVNGRERSIQRLLTLLQGKPEYRDVLHVLHDHVSLMDRIDAARYDEGLAA